jgi:hypothetical protein
MYTENPYVTGEETKPEDEITEWQPIEDVPYSRSSH